MTKRSVILVHVFGLRSWCKNKVDWYGSLFSCKMFQTFITIGWLWWFNFNDRMDFL